jgi:hypothetical protein
MTTEIDDDGVEVREVRYVEPDDYTDIVNWLLMGSAMTAKADAARGDDAGFMSQGMLVAALHVEKLEAEVLKLKQQLYDRSRH